MAGQYVHCPTGAAYVWVDETDAEPVPNSIYSDDSGFTHDYYSGTTATPDQLSRCLGITPHAWAFGGPVTVGRGYVQVFLPLVQKGSHFKIFVPLVEKRSSP